MDGAFTYTETHTLETEDAYPYTGRDGTCKEPKATTFINKGFSDVASESSTQLELAVSQHPVSVAIEADRLVFQMYTSGIITSANCGTNLDHGVLVVGYGTESN